MSTNPPDSPSVAPDSSSSEDAFEELSFAEAQNFFCASLLPLLECSGWNLVFCASSLRLVLGMALAGAKGETAAELERALFLSDGDQAHRELAAFLERFQGGEASGNGASVANAVWAQEGCILRRDYLDRIAECYRAAVESVDFAGDPGAACEAINAWVSDQTRGRIRGLVSPDALSPVNRLVLINTVYFKARWSTVFDATETREEPFFLYGGDSVSTPMMQFTEKLGYHAGEGFQAVSLDYEDSNVAMVILLPDDREGLPQLEARLASPEVQRALQPLPKREVELALPRFRLQSNLHLNQALADLGMPTAFSPQDADFSGTNGRRASQPEGFFLSDVFQRAIIEVNEEGTEAIASTFAGMLTGLQEEPDRVPRGLGDGEELYDRGAGGVLCDGRSREDGLAPIGSGSTFWGTPPLLQIPRPTCADLRLLALHQVRAAPDRNSYQGSGACPGAGRTKVKEVLGRCR